MLCRVVFYQLSQPPRLPVFQEQCLKHKAEFPQTVCGFCMGHLIRGSDTTPPGLAQEQLLAASKQLTVCFPCLPFLFAVVNPYFIFVNLCADPLCLFWSRVTIFSIFFLFFLPSSLQFFHKFCVNNTGVTFQFCYVLTIFRQKNGQIGWMLACCLLGVVLSLRIRTVTDGINLCQKSVQ